MHAQSSYQEHVPPGSLGVPRSFFECTMNSIWWFSFFIPSTPALKTPWSEIYDHRRYKCETIHFYVLYSFNLSTTSEPWPAFYRSSPLSILLTISTTIARTPWDCMSPSSCPTFSSSSPTLIVCGFGSSACAGCFRSPSAREPSEVSHRSGPVLSLQPLFFDCGVVASASVTVSLMSFSIIKPRTHILQRTAHENLPVIDWR